MTRSALFVTIAVLLPSGCHRGTPVLGSGETVSGKIRAGERVALRVIVPFGQVAHLLIRQQEIDLEVVAEAIVTNATDWDWESVYTEGTDAGTAEVTIAAASDGPRRGAYTMRVEALLPRTEITGAALEAQAMEARGRQLLAARTAESLPRAQELLGNAVLGWRRASDRRRLGHALMGYGIASERVAQFQRAEEAYLEAVRILEDTGDRLAYLGAKKTWANLGGRFAEERAPIAVLQARLSEARTLGDGRMVALYMSSLATAYGRAGELDRDLEMKKSLLVLARRMGDEVLETAILEKLGALQLSALRFEEASRYAEAAIGMARSRGEIGAEAAALSLLCAVQGDSGRDAAQAESLQRLLVIHERRSDTGAWAVSAISLAKNLIRRGLPEEALRVFVEIEEKTDSYYRAAGSPSLQFVAPGESPIAYVAAQLNILGESFARPTLELVDRQRARFLGGARGRTLSMVQESLPEDLAIVEFVLARSGGQPGYLWLLTRDDVRLFRTAAVVPAVDEIRRTAEALERPDGINRTDYKEWERLSEVLLGPLRGQLGARRLVVVPDEAMARLPVALMLDPDHSDGSRLGDHHLVTYTPTMLLAGDIDAKRGAGVDLLIAGDPVTSTRDLRMSRRDGTTEFSRLAYADEEAREVARAAGGRRVRQWMGFEATRARVASEMTDARIVHLISHGVSDWEKLRNSGLALTMWDRDGKPLDGMLRFEEIAGSTLRADLVTLSACDTAVGRVVGYHGVPSLANAFLRAGARRVVSTLWKVDDAATAALMGAFYRNLFAGGKVLPGEALWKAQMHIAGQRRWRAPYFWAGFTLSGDWGRL